MTTPIAVITQNLKPMESFDQNYIEINRELWNAKVSHHVNSDFYGLPEFKAGTNVLQSIELDQVGDVKGKTLLHLQCHFGMDTLSWARLGAEVTGVDLSDQAIEAAQQLSAELQIPGRFICCNVYDLPQYLDEQFDIVFTSYGVLGWLPDLEKWGEVVARYLKPGGEFHLIEFHPVVWMFDDAFEKVAYSYFQKETIVEETEGTYADREAPIKNTSVSWNHPLEQVFSALLQQGLQIVQFSEFDYSPYNCFQKTIPGPDKGWQIQGMEGKLPMVYGLKAVKPL